MEAIRKGHNRQAPSCKIYIPENSNRVWIGLIVAAKKRKVNRQSSGNFHKFVLKSL